MFRKFNGEKKKKNANFDDIDIKCEKRMLAWLDNLSELDRAFVTPLLYTFIRCCCKNAAIEVEG